MDLSLQGAGMWKCVNGHTFCECHIDVTISDEEWSWEKRKGILLKWFDGWKPGEKEKLTRINSEELFEDHFSGWWREYWDEYIENVRCSCPKNFCPICSFRDVPDEDLVAYLFKEKAMSRPGFVSFLAKKFGTYDRFKEYIK